MKLFLRLIFPCIFLLPLFGNAQVSDSVIKQNALYIKDYKHQLTTRFYLLSESVGFRVNPTGQKIPIHYIPNNDIKNGLAIFHKWYGIGLAVNNPFAGKDVDKKGMSSIFDIRLNAYGSALAAELSVQDYKGFFWKNVDQLPLVWDHESPYPQRSDMHLFSTSAIFYYIPNHKKHSFRAAYLQNERQLKSAGSLIIMPSFVYLSLQSDSSLIPDHYSSFYAVPEDEHIINGKFFTYGISIGYSYTFVFLKNFYLNLSMIPGAFIQQYNYEYSHGKKKVEKFAIMWLGRAAFGFNSDIFYAGLGGVYGFKATQLNVGQTNFNYDMNQIRLWIGTRFGLGKKY